MSIQEIIREHQKIQNQITQHTNKNHDTTIKTKQEMQEYKQKFKNVWQHRANKNTTIKIWN